MRFVRLAIASFLTTVVLLTSLTPSRACGPSYIEPIYVFRESPDPPFEEFIQGKIGILQPTFGRKTLFIAYRHLNGWSFTADEQQALMDALRAKSPEDNISEAIKAWVKARKSVALKEAELPEIYVERQYRNYDFFPNCGRNAFEVATETLNDRVSEYGADNPSVQVWLAGQDAVFQNCAGGGDLPKAVGAESPRWLRKDRDYQVAAALFYSLNLDDARVRFKKIADDSESPWHQTADYLVARTLVRHASLTENAEKKRELYKQAEEQLQILMNAGGKFGNASAKLLGLVKYRIHPEERVRELADVLAHRGGNENLRQDLIDYTWLLDKFETQILNEEEKRRKALAGKKEEENSGRYRNEVFESIQKGELIAIRFAPKDAEGKESYANYIVLHVAPDTPEAEILQAVEQRLGRKLTPEETQEVSKSRASELAQRDWLLAPNRKLSSTTDGRYEGDYYGQDKPPFSLFPAFLRADDLSNWILTFQSSDRGAAAHAFSTWRTTGSAAWLAIAIAKAETTSPGVNRMLREAESISRESPLFATAVYHRVRLKISSSKLAEARRLLDEVISTHAGELPRSAQNQLLEQRMMLAENLQEFLKFGARRPIAFYNDGAIGTMKSLLESAKRFWSPDYHQTKEEYEREIEKIYENLLPWDERLMLDHATIDILNWHLPLQKLADAARDPAWDGDLRARLILAVWTRAILLNNEEVERQVAPEVLKAAPTMAGIFTPYLEARTPLEKRNAALYVLLKFPSLSPLVDDKLESSFVTTEESDYYFESAWWCPLPETDYDNQGNEVPKVVNPPGFLTSKELETARLERKALNKLGDGKIFLGKRVLEWAKTSPEDSRIPEALFIAAQANRSYKFGCDGWSFDEPTKNELEAILQKRYPASLWTAKLDPNESP